MWSTAAFTRTLEVDVVAVNAEGEHVRWIVAPESRYHIPGGSLVEVTAAMTVT